MFKIFKKDNLKLGLLWGFIAPFIGMYGYYLWKARSAGSFIEFVKYLGWQKSIITTMVSFSLLANAILFTIYINSHIDKTAKGIFIMTLIFAIGALILKIMY